MAIRIDRIVVRQIRMPLVHFFETSFGRTYTPRHHSGRGRWATALSGWGEVTAGENPFYNEEWTASAWRILRRLTSPRACSGATSTLPRDVAPAHRPHPRPQHGARRAGSRRLGSGGPSRTACPLWQTDRRRRATKRDSPAASPSASRTRVAQLLEKIRTRTRRRLPAHQDEDQARLGRRSSSARCAASFPSIQLMADANSAYTLADIDHLRSWTIST